MRSFLRLSLSLISIFLLNLFCAAYAGSEFIVKVKDPQSLPVQGARVTIYAPGSDKPLAAALTDRFGEAKLILFNGSSEVRVEVLAAKFKAATLLTKEKSIEVTLVLAARNDAVTVTANQSLLTTEQSGVRTYVLDRASLEVQQPFDAADMLRTLPGATVSQSGRRGSLSSLFLRGGDSRYTKVLVDGVAVNDAGGTFDFGVVGLDETERVELVRGAESTLYGSDAMTGALQFFSANGHTNTPELRLSADGGTFSTAQGSAALAGSYKRLDYNFFASQTSTNGQGPNDAYQNAVQGANIGLQLHPKLAFRLRVRHSNNRSGIQSFWNFNGQPLLAPITDEFARQNNLIASGEFTWTPSAHWTHTFSGTEYRHIRLNVDTEASNNCSPPFFIDCAFTDRLAANRAGFEYRGEYLPRAWLRTVFGVEYEDENGYVDQNFSGFIETGHGLRQNTAFYVQQAVLRRRWSLVAGVRYVHNGSFGDRAVPRVAANVLAFRGGEFFSGTSLRFAYGEGYKEPRLEESFGAVGAFGPVTLPNPKLKAESNQEIETGFIQRFIGGKVTLAGTYFHQVFHDQIAFNFDFLTFTSQYVNLNRALSHGAEVELHADVARGLVLDASWLYNATQVLSSPNASDPLLQPGKPLIRRPLHSGNAVLRYSGHSLFGRDVHRSWGGSVGGSFIGRRADSDFLFPPLGVTHSAGYARFDVGGWVAVRRRVTAFANVENAFNRHYEESAGYPALRANIRAGLRFRLGGD